MPIPHFMNLLDAALWRIPFTSLIQMHLYDLIAHWKGMSKERGCSNFLVAVAHNQSALWLVAHETLTELKSVVAKVTWLTTSTLHALFLSPLCLCRWSLVSLFFFSPLVPRPLLYCSRWCGAELVWVQWSLSLVFLADWLHSSSFH